MSQSEYGNYLARRAVKATTTECAAESGTQPSEVGSSELEATLARIEAEGRYAQAIDVLPGARYRLTVRRKSPEHL